MSEVHHCYQCTGSLLVVEKDSTSAEQMKMEAKKINWPLIKRELIAVQILGV